MIYTCNKCGKIFTKKYNYNKHLARKTSCTINNHNNIILDTNNKNETNDNVEKTFPKRFQSVSKRFQTKVRTYECLLCHKKYDTRSGLYKHKKTHDNYILEIEKQKNDSEQKQVINNNNIINNNLNINNLTINFGDEQLPKLTYDEEDNIFRNPKESIYQLTKTIMCNPKLPDNQTIKIDNLYSNFLYVKQDGAFVVDRKYKIITSLAHNMSQQLQTLVAKKKHLSTNTRETYHIICDEHNDLTEDSLKKNKNIFDKYVVVLYNNKIMSVEKLDE